MVKYKIPEVINLSHISFYLKDCGTIDEVTKYIDLLEKLQSHDQDILLSSKR